MPDLFRHPPLILTNGAVPAGGPRNMGSRQNIILLGTLVRGDGLRYGRS